MSFNVGGVLLPRPFKIRRLGHFGFNVADVDVAMAFYAGLLGLKVSDDIDFGPPRNIGFDFSDVGSTIGYFLRHAGDHHSFAIFPRKAMDRLVGDAVPDAMTINQLSWQIGTMDEVFQGNDWLVERGYAVPRIGRDTPGSNWHTYPVGPAGVLNELYCGMEQIGWQERSKPAQIWHSYSEVPQLPHISEYEELKLDGASGHDLSAGWRNTDEREAVYEVEGLMLPQPFRVVKVGPVRLFVDDMEEALPFYRDTLGLTVTESVDWSGHSCHFLRTNTEHHSLALYPVALREELAITTRDCLSFGFQLGSYTQLRNAVRYLEKAGCTIKYLPQELTPGIDYSALVMDPDGHALQLYHYMEQIGWDGKPRPASQRRQVTGSWPETLEAQSDEYGGEIFQGPLG
jgi:catechol 2,3-dioxygenase-like lactoylglutathione lyase family enzyme